MRFNFLKAIESLQGNLLFTTKFPEIADTHLIELGWMKGWVDLSNPVVLNMGPLDWESGVFTTNVFCLVVYWNKV